MTGPVKAQVAQLPCCLPVPTKPIYGKCRFVFASGVQGGRDSCYAVRRSVSGGDTAVFGIFDAMPCSQTGDYSVDTVVDSVAGTATAHCSGDFASPHMLCDGGGGECKWEVPVPTCTAPPAPAPPATGLFGRVGVEQLTHYHEEHPVCVAVQGSAVISAAHEIHTTFPRALMLCRVPRLQPGVRLSFFLLV